jgi:hypothetical protein
MFTPAIHAPRLSTYIWHVGLGTVVCANTCICTLRILSVWSLFSYPYLAVLVTESLVRGSSTKTPAFTKRKVASPSPYDHQLVIYHPR